MIARIRKEGNQYLVYFLETRRLIGVNQTGVQIIDWYFNDGLNSVEVAEKLTSTYGTPIKQSMYDVDTFLQAMVQELQPEMFNNTEQLPIDVPIGAELEITTACNLRCRHCLQSDYASFFMGTEKARQIIKILANAGVFEISIIGGEPFKHPRISDIIREAHDRGLAVGLTSNGSMITDAHIDTLVGLDNVSVAISVDGIGKDHDYIRGKGVFAKVDRTIRHMIEAGIEVETMFTVTSYNLNLFKTVLKYCKELDIVCNFNLFKPFKKSHAQLVPDPIGFFGMVKELFELRKSHAFKIGLSNAAIVSYLMGLPIRDDCRAGQSGLVIDAHGRMLTCPSLLYCGYYTESDFPPFNENFVTVWKTHPLFTEFKKNGLSGCQARSLIFSGDVRKGDPYDVASFRRFVERQ
jgi:MoaA/NifB/PqqE/SkfB family radical SAM enzyme